MQVNYSLKWRKKIILKHWNYELVVRNTNFEFKLVNYSSRSESLEHFFRYRTKIVARSNYNRSYIKARIIHRFKVAKSVKIVKPWCHITRIKNESSRMRNTTSNSLNSPSALVLSPCFHYLYVVNSRLIHFIERFIRRLPHDGFVCPLAALSH